MASMDEGVIRKGSFCKKYNHGREGLAGWGGLVRGYDGVSFVPWCRVPQSGLDLTQSMYSLACCACAPPTLPLRKLGAAPLPSCSAILLHSSTNSLIRGCSLYGFEAVILE